MQRVGHILHVKQLLLFFKSMIMIFDDNKIAIFGKTAENKDGAIETSSVSYFA